MIGPGYNTALVTGASRGIGAAVVRALGERGLEVHAAARSAEALAALAETTGCIPHALDLTDTAAVEARFGGLPVDVLVNNAGVITATGPLHELTAEQIDGMIDLNLRSVLQLLRVVLPGMIARDRGHIVNVGSTAGRYILPGAAVYGATKAAVHALSNVLRLDLVGRRVRVTVVAPGRVETDIYLQATGGDRAAMRDRFYDRYESLDPADIAAAVGGAIEAPERVDVSYVEVLPTMQAVGGFQYAERQPRQSK